MKKADPNSVKLPFAALVFRCHLHITCKRWQSDDGFNQIPWELTFKCNVYSDPRSVV